MARRPRKQTLRDPASLSPDGQDEEMALTPDAGPSMDEQPDDAAEAKELQRKKR